MNTLIPKHDAYRTLKSFQIARLIYDINVRFCDKFINSKSRTHDQMVQAARSRVQNIAEGGQASGTSKKTELKLTNVARASIEKLNLDYEDFLRQRKLHQWEYRDQRIRDLIEKRLTTADWFALWAKQQQGSCIEEIAANSQLALIIVACSLLNRQITAQAEAFTNEGGFTERLYRLRKETRKY